MVKLDKKYVVYIIHYNGTALEPKNGNSNIIQTNYIGSTTIDKISKGYMGSVSSKKYKKVWKHELKYNIDAFKIDIIRYHYTKSEAMYKELHLHKIFNVVKNPLFVNMSYATVNGYFGRDQNGKNNARFGKNNSNEHNEKISNSLKDQKRTLEQRNNISASLKKKPKSTAHKISIGKAKKDKPQSIEHIKKRVNAITGKIRTQSQKDNISKGKLWKPQPLTAINNTKTKSADWHITDPDGNLLSITNLKQFCSDNGLNYKSAVSYSKKGIATSSGINAGWIFEKKSISQ